MFEKDISILLRLNNFVDLINVVKIYQRFFLLLAHSLRFFIYYAFTVRNLNFETLVNFEPTKIFSFGYQFRLIIDVATLYLNAITSNNAFPVLI